MNDLITAKKRLSVIRKSTSLVENTILGCVMFLFVYYILIEMSNAI